MILTAVYVRFYKAFNYDYLRKSHPGATPDPWDLMEDKAFYPYISLPLDTELTAVVGANESGKSQLLDAIECALGQATPKTADFCRYSTYFTVAEAMKIPHFGLHCDGVSPSESERIVKAVDLDESTTIGSFWVFRTRRDKVEIYLGQDKKKHDVKNVRALNDLLPRVFRIDARRAIPDSVPIEFLAKGGHAGNADPGLARADRLALTYPITQRASELTSKLGNPTEFGALVEEIIETVTLPSGRSVREEKKYRSQLDLAFDLMVTVGGIHPTAFDDLKEALQKDQGGWVNGIVAAMNAQLAESLDLAKRWSQDRQFSLATTVRDHDIAFTIRDRTGSEYSFAERSDGLKYFLSYLVQFLAHTGTRTNSEILLMDEPDAFLSNQGQQDLLRLLQGFASPIESDAPSGQVVYVTHSPFLIDKNRADRIRVLDKGTDAEGTRVVRDAGRNHFEPIRTALGGFVGEMAFIGNCNLMLEGVADQIYLSGMSTRLRRNGFANTEYLDLNRITLVPCGSAGHVQYMTHLARGRDADKPAVIVLLDGDKAGNDAVKALKRSKKLIRPEYVKQIKAGGIPRLTSDRPDGPLSIEDLIPIEIGIAAARRYLEEMGIKEPDNFPTPESVRALLPNAGIFRAIKNSLSQADIDFNLEKVGFARHVLASYDCDKTDNATEMRDRFAALFSCLTQIQRQAERERERRSIAARVARETRAFLRDHQRSIPTKAQVSVLLERIQAVIDPSIEGHALLGDITMIRKEFKLDRDLKEPIHDLNLLKARIQKLQYAEVLASQSEDGLV